MGRDLRHKVSRNVINNTVLQEAYTRRTFRVNLTLRVSERGAAYGKVLTDGGVWLWLGCVTNTHVTPAYSITSDHRQIYLARSTDQLSPKLI